MDAGSEVRRHGHCPAAHLPRADLAQKTARSRSFLVLFFQVAMLGLLAWRGFSGPRLILHAACCVLYAAACPRPTPAVSSRSKAVLLAAGFVAFAGWLVNTGGVTSPFLSLVLGIVLPAVVFFDTPRQKGLLLAGSLGLLLLVALASALPAVRLVHPLSSVDGRPSVEYVVIATGSLAVTVANILGFWAEVTSAYAKVAAELVNRREELCSMGEDRTRELEGAASHLAHEMKNPLASIKALSAHLARAPSLDPRTVERLEVVSAEADRLESIVDSFISLSRGLGELHLQTVRPYAIAVELKALLDERAADAAVSIEVEGQSDLEVVADERKIQRALFYLTMNAVQASSAGQAVTIRVESGSLRGSVAIRIIDRGRGMCPMVLERLTRPPFSTRKGGSGLGVAVARALVLQHGGQIQYQSVPRQGTTVTIELPHRPPQHGPCPPPALSAHLGSAQAG